MSIANEFKKAFLKGLQSQSEKLNCTASQLQIVLSLSAQKEVVYRVYQSYSHIGYEKFENLFSIPLIYKPFKWKIVDGIKKALLHLENSYPDQTVNAFLTPSKTPGEVRVMLYLNGVYAKDLSFEDFNIKEQ